MDIKNVESKIVELEEMLGAEYSQERESELLLCK